MWAKFLSTLLWELGLRAFTALTTWLTSLKKKEETYKDIDDRAKEKQKGIDDAQTPTERDKATDDLLDRF